MRNIYDFTLEELKKYFLSKGEKAFRATQVFEAIYKLKVSSLDEITTIKKSTIEAMKQDLSMEQLVLKERQISSDETNKFLFELSDGNLIETVLMNHDYGKSICVTSQVGCNMGCKFCASGLIKKKRNLTIGEMVLQILEVEKICNVKIGHVVVMGIGEPFDNYENVMSFISIINQPKGLEIGSRHITVSTSGLVPKILEYASNPLQTNLAISFHAPTDEIRSMLMPINKRYPIHTLLSAIDAYIERTGRRVTIEYILLKDVNDSLECARLLGELFHKRLVYINLIPYNTVTETGLFRSDVEQMKAFYDKLKKMGLNVTLRREQGHDIDAACGQLRNRKIKE